MKYFIPEIRVIVVATIIMKLENAKQNLFRLNVWQTKINVVAMSCKTVFNFPRKLAAITLPFNAVVKRIEVIKNSLETIIDRNMEFRRLSSTKQIIAQITKILSANGSKNFPKLEIKLNFLAIMPSIASVMLAIIKSNKAIILQVMDESNFIKAIKNGTIKILALVRMLAAFIKTILLKN